MSASFDLKKDPDTRTIIGVFDKFSKDEFLEKCKEEYEFDDKFVSLKIVEESYDTAYCRYIPAYNGYQLEFEDKSGNFKIHGIKYQLIRK